MFAQCGGTVTVSSVHTLVASHYWTVRMFQQWGAYQYHKSCFFLISLMLLCSAFLSFFSAHVSFHASPRFHPRFTRFLPRISHLPRSLSRNHAQGRGRGMVFFPQELCWMHSYREFVVFVLLFLHSLIFKWIMNLHMLRLEAVIEGFIYTIQINRPCPLRGLQYKNLNSLTSQLSTIYIRTYLS